MLIVLHFALAPSGVFIIFRDIIAFILMDKENFDILMQRSQHCNNGTLNGELPSISLDIVGVVDRTAS
ncbi:hypothetical protein VNO80_29236 [Phaseolus coccineus]|uniref:Uncharacterized protein n=1 Tax=Phaseolus coccineus TaxID=3886 RepID=A0AAN9LDZ0_PHACN